MSTVVDKGDEMSKRKCKHCEQMVASSSHKRHEARCAIFAPITDFVNEWNADPSVPRMARKYKVKYDRFGKFLFYLRDIGYSVLKPVREVSATCQHCGWDIMPTTYERHLEEECPNPPNQRQETSAEPETRCSICTVINHGDPCVFCQQDADGRPNGTRRSIIEALPR